MEDSPKSGVKSIIIYPHKLFSGNIYNYGLTYDNNFELSRDIILFTNIVEHQNSIYYSQFNFPEVTTKKDQVSQPVWLLDSYKHFEYQDDTARYVKYLKNIGDYFEGEKNHLKILKKLELTILKNGKISQSNMKKKDLLERKHSNVKFNKKEDDVSLNQLVMDQMHVLDKDIFIKNKSDFKVKYIVDFTNCSRVKSSDLIFSSCLNNSEQIYQNLENIKSSRSKLPSLIIQDFLSSDQENGDLILYRDDKQSFGQESLRKKNKKQFNSKFNTNKIKYAMDLGLSSSVNPVVSPSLYIKQVTLIKHFTRSFFLVITKKSLLSIYDIKTKAVFYLFKIYEKNFIPEIEIVGDNLFAIRIKQNPNEAEFFKILIFQFYEESMSCRLINKNTRLINYVDGDIFSFEGFVYFVTLSMDSFKMTVYKFPRDIEKEELRSRDIKDLSEFNQTWLNKNHIDLASKFANAAVLENYIHNLKSLKIKCRKNKFQFVECVIQSNYLDNILLTMKIVQINSIKEQLSKDRILSKSQKKCEKPKSLFEQLTNDNRDIIRHTFSEHLFSFFKLKKLESNNIFIKMSSFQLIRNEYIPGIVQVYENYFYKRFLILVYQVDSFLRIYFYYLGLPSSANDLYHMNDIQIQKNMENKKIEFCSAQKKYHFKPLYYRMELKTTKSKFLGLKFGYFFRETAQEEVLLSSNQKIWVDDLISVVFDNRIENYNFNEYLSLTIKKKVLDFEEVSIFAKNHKATIKGRKLIFVILS